jgi:hypothetical protein
MLTPEQIAALQDAAARVADPINDFLVEDIARRIAGAGQLTSTASYQIWRAQQLGLSQREIKKRLRKLLNVSNRELRRLLTQSAEVGYDFDIKRLPYVQALPFEQNAALQQIVSAAVRLAQEDFTNLTQTLGMVGPNGVVLPLQDAYRECMDYAFRQVSTGATDYNTAIRRATKNLADLGVRIIDYESGVHTSIEAATRRNIMGGLGLMMEQITKRNHDDLGADGWEISAHANSAPDHEPIQGRQYTDAEYEALNNSLRRRIGTLNCGHVAFPILLGINSPQYTQDELRALREDNERGITYDGQHYTGYEATQMQRKVERSIRKQKNRILVDEATGDAEKLRTDQIRLRRLNEEYKRFSSAAGLRTEPERAVVAGFGPGQAKRATAGAEQHYQKWSKEIGANESIESLAKYYDVKYTDSPRYALLQGYARAVEKHDISPLVGFKQYEQTSADIQSRIVGTTTFTGVQIESFATHFIDRVIGQTSTPHPGMRRGVSIEDVLDALLHPDKIGEIRHLDDGDIRQTVYGENAVVALSIRDKRLIQTNPRNG